MNWKALDYVAAARFFYRENNYTKESANDKMRWYGGGYDEAVTLGSLSGVWLDLAPPILNMHSIRDTLSGKVQQICFIAWLWHNCGLKLQPAA